MYHLLEPASANRRTGGFIYNLRVSTELADRLSRHAVAAEELADLASDITGKREVAIIDSLFLFDPAVVKALEGAANRDRLVGLVHYLPSDRPGLSTPGRASLMRTERAAGEVVTGGIATSRYMVRRLTRIWRGVPVCLAVPPGVESQPDPVGAHVPPARLVSIGPVTAAKGQTLGVSALSQLRRYRFRWDIVGSLDVDPAYVRVLRHRLLKLGLTDRVMLRGSVPPKEIPRLLAEADLCVGTSLQEAYGMACREALASAVPVVAFDTGGLREVVTEGRDGLLVRSAPPGRVERLADALERCFASRSAFGRLAEGALDSSRRHRSWATVGSEFAEALTTLVGGG